MKILKAKTDFCFKGTWYSENDDVPVYTVEDLVKLNEKGFVEPQTIKDIQNFTKDNKKNFKKEEE